MSASHLARACAWLCERGLDSYYPHEPSLSALLSEVEAEAQRAMRERAAAVAESYRIRNATEDGVLVESGYMQDGIAAAIRSLQ